MIYLEMIYLEMIYLEMIRVYAKVTAVEIRGRSLNKEVEQTFDRRRRRSNATLAFQFVDSNVRRMVLVVPARDPAGMG